MTVVLHYSVRSGPRQRAPRGYLARQLLCLACHVAQMTVNDHCVCGVQRCGHDVLARSERVKLFSSSQLAIDRCSAAGQDDDRHNASGRDWHMYMWFLQQPLVKASTLIFDV